MTTAVDRPLFNKARIFLGWVLAVAAIVPFLSIPAAAQESAAPAYTAPVPWSSFSANANPYGFDKPLPIRIGEVPVSIRVPDAAVDAAVELGEIQDGVMLNPSSSEVVAWYRASGRIGSSDNILMSGHLDWWDVGPAVFYELPLVQPGALIEITTESGATFAYTVEWVKHVAAADQSPEVMREIVGPAESEMLTLITCGGPFDYERGVYLERVVVRARPLT